MTRRLKCPKCNKFQPSGKFCLDCGVNLEEHIELGVKFNKIKTYKGTNESKANIRKWLNRIGVQNPDIQILTEDQLSATVKYKLLGREYSFTSKAQINLASNMASVEQFLHHRVLGIERGIESKEQAFKGYEALPSPDYYKKKYFEGCKTKEEIETRYKELLKILHPDFPTGSANSFIELKNQYEELMKQWEQ